MALFWASIWAWSAILKKPGKWQCQHKRRLELFAMDEGASFLEYTDYEYRYVISVDSFRRVGVKPRLIE